MPVTIRRKGRCVTVRTPRGLKARCTTRKNAERQRRLLHAIDHGLRRKASR